MKEKKIETLELSVKELKTDFGNPRKITKKKREELERSLEDFGDFGLILIDEHNNIIAGNQRVSILKEKNPDTVVLCKKLIGYSNSELRAINIKDNVHSGDWDLDILADWTADLNIDLGLELTETPEERKIKDMELIHYEKYDYVLIACRYETDYNDLVRKLGIEGKKVMVCKTRGIKARAIWYEDMKSQLVYKEDEQNDE